MATTDLADIFFLLQSQMLTFERCVYRLPQTPGSADIGLHFSGVGAPLTIAIKVPVEIMQIVWV